MAQSLKDSLFGGKLKADTGKTFISKDTSKYVPPKVYNASPSAQGETKKVEIVKLDESMPDSASKIFYTKQKTWKLNRDRVRNWSEWQSNDQQYYLQSPYEYLTEQVTELMKRTPTLSPPVYSDGKPRKLNATQSITIIKK